MNLSPILAKVFSALFVAMILTSGTAFVQLQVLVEKVSNLEDRVVAYHKD